MKTLTPKYEYTIFQAGCDVISKGETLEDAIYESSLLGWHLRIDYIERAHKDRVLIDGAVYYTTEGVV